MIDYDRGDVVVLALDVDGDYRDADAVPRALSIPGIGEVLGVGADSVADRVALLSTLEELKRADLVVERRSRVVGLEGERQAYVLTGAGRERARDLRDELVDERVRVHEGDGTERTIPLDSVGECLPEPPLPRALARLTDEGVLYLDGEVSEDFVNRETELDRLTTALEAARDGATRSALVGGEVGVGKTTLVTDELAARAENGGVRVLVGQCQREGTEPYAPFKAALDDVLATADGSPFERGGLGPADASAFRAERTAVYETVASLVAESARTDGPFVLALDDLHLAGEPTLSLFSHLVEYLDAPALLVGTYRPTDVGDGGPLEDLIDGFEDHEGRVRVDLDPFDRGHTRDQVASVVGRRTVPGDFVDLVYERTGGNPLFVAESVGRMVETGAVDPDRGVYPDDETAIPLADRVESVVEDRLAALDDVGRTVLSVGGLLGQAIPREVLVEATPADEAAVERRIELLVDGGAWERTGDDLRFASGLVRETVVDRIPEKRRRELHGRIATAVESVRGEDPGHHATAARHRERAGDHERAFDHAMRAAEHAKAEYANEAARENYQRALELARDRLGYDEDDDRVVAVLEGLADTYHLLGEYEEADKYYQYVADRVTDPERYREIAWIRAGMFDSRSQFERALAVTDEAVDRHGVADTVRTVHLLTQRGNAHNKLENRDDAEADFDRAVEIAERIEDPSALAVAYDFAAGHDIHWNEIDDETVAVLERSVAAAEEAGDDRILANAVNDLAMAHMRLERLDEAERVFQRCLDLHEAIGDEVALAKAYRNLSRIFRLQGNLGRARETLTEALATAERIRNTPLLAAVHEDLGSVDLALGDVASALDHRRRTLELCRELGRAVVLASRMASLADAHLLASDRDRAAELAEEAAAVAADLDDPISLASAARIRGDVALFDGDVDRALDRFEDAIDYAGRDDHPATAVPEFDGRRGLAECLVALDDPEGASEQVEAAADLERRLDGPSNVGAESELALLRGRIARTDGEYDAAEDALDEALGTARDPHTRAAVEECRALLERARLERDRGNPAAARERATEALDLAAEKGIERYESACRDLLADLESGPVGP